MESATINFGQTLGQGVPGRETDRDGRSREVFLTDGKTIKLEATDPFGYWVIRWPSGRTPEEIEGHYTNADEALKALSRYAAQLYNTQISPEKVVIPELKTKQTKKD